MGQAKNRGSLDERRLQADHRRRAIAESLGLKQRPLAEIKEELGLPESAVFHGYAVHLPESDEFLSGHTDRNDSLMRGWSKGPALAKLFEDFVEAFELIRAERGEIVVAVFETDTQFVVSEVL